MLFALGAVLAVFFVADEIATLHSTIKYLRREVEVARAHEEVAWERLFKTLDDLAVVKAQLAARIRSRSTLKRQSGPTLR